MAIQGPQASNRSTTHKSLETTWGTWVAQLVEHLTLDFSSHHDLLVHGIEPHVGLHAGSAEPAWNSLSASPQLVHAHSLKINKLKKKTTSCTLFLK